MIKHNIGNILCKNSVLFVCGFCIYITIEVLYKNSSHWLMGMLGGICMCIIGGLNNYISWDMPLIAQMITGASIITFFELIVGLADKYFWHIGMWDYSNMPMNFKGVICVPFFFVWMILSFFAIILSDAIEYYIFHEEQRPYYRSMFGKILFWFPERVCI